MNNYDFVTGLIGADPKWKVFEVNAEDGYMTYANDKRDYFLVFCNWDLGSNNPYDRSCRCELRIDDAATDEIYMQLTLTGLNQDEQEIQIKRFLEFADKEYA